MPLARLRSALSFGSLGGILVMAMLAAWAWGRYRSGAASDHRADRRRNRTSVAFLGWGMRTSGWTATNARIVHYPPFPNFFIGWQRLERLPGSAGSRVAYAGTNIPYYLFGKDLRNEVRYVNIDRHRDWLLHDYHREAMAQGRGHLAEPEAGLGSS